MTHTANDATNPTTVAREWVDALDAEKFAAAVHLLDEKCVYYGPTNTITGPDDIVKTYRDNAAWAHKAFDKITWDSELESLGQGRFMITFIDRTTHAGLDHVYRCRQVIEVNGHSLIDRIEHIAIPDEETRLAAFMKQTGVKRPGE